VTRVVRRAAVWAALLGLAAGGVAAGQEGEPPRAARRAPDDELALSTDWALAREAAADGPRAVLVGELLERWRSALACQLYVDAQAQGVRVPVPASITWGETRALLELHDVVVVEGPGVGGSWSVRAHHRRSLSQKECRPRVVEADALPAHNELVSVTLRVRHGQGSQIFAALRALLTRDPNRLGNILFLPSSETLVVVDLAPRVAYYAELLRRLDVPLARHAHRVIRRGAEELAKLLREAIGANQGLDGAVIVADPAGGQVVVTGPSAAVAHLRQQLEALDAP